MREVKLENQTSPNTEAHNALLASYMPHHKTKVIAPIEFFFGQMDNYKIKGLTYYLLYEQENKKIPLLAFFQNADREGVEYIISDYGKESSYDIPANAPNEISAYKRVFQDNLSSIYARQSKDN